MFLAVMGIFACFGILLEDVPMTAGTQPAETGYSRSQPPNPGQQGGC